MDLLRYADQHCPGPHVRVGHIPTTFEGWSKVKPKLTGRCTKCRLCFVLCPDAAIQCEEEPSFNYSLCKGCGICANECPTSAIEMLP